MSSTRSSSRKIKDVPTTQHKGSCVLDKDENQRLFDTMSSDMTCLAAGVAQFRALKDGHWKVLRFGICALVKDCKKSQCIVKFFSLLFEEKWFGTWSKEFRVKIDSLNPSFWKVTMNNQMYIVEFLSSTDADHMNACLDRNWFKTNQQQLDELPAPFKRSTSLRNKPRRVRSRSLVDKFTSSRLYNLCARDKSTEKQLLEKRDKNEKKTGKLTVKDIGQPFGFQHVVHLGWDSINTTDQASNLDSLVKAAYADSSISLPPPNRIAPSPPSSKNVIDLHKMWPSAPTSTFNEMPGGVCKSKSVDYAEPPPTNYDNQIDLTELGDVPKEDEWVDEEEESLTNQQMEKENEEPTTEQENEVYAEIDKNKKSKTEDVEENNQYEDIGQNSDHIYENYQPVSKKTANSLEKFVNDMTHNEQLLVMHLIHKKIRKAREAPIQTELEVTKQDDQNLESENQELDQNVPPDDEPKPTPAPRSTSPEKSLIRL
ncbi:Neural Wiskott-Aldrich syndrome protein [Aphelenchoides bicaudatus]|nr:Neural Wiskott-Aldrich syndrome protein [Aphelenchoides bicaudatus]